MESTKTKTMLMYVDHLLKSDSLEIPDHPSPTLGNGFIGDQILPNRAVLHSGVEVPFATTREPHGEFHGQR